MQHKILGLNPTNLIVKTGFIVVEGIDGSGKSTFCKLLNLVLQPLDSWRIVGQPGGTWLADTLKTVIKTQGADPNKQADPRAVHLLMEAARVDLMNKIEESLVTGEVFGFISDRHVDSTWAYQPTMGVPHHQIGMIQTVYKDRIEPDFTIFIDVPIEVAKKRISTRSDIDFFESKPDSFFQQCLSNYYERIKLNRDKYFVIDGTLQPLDNVQQILSLISYEKK